MRRHIFAGAVLFMLAVLESAFLPRLLGDFPRPGLVLVTSASWAAIRGTEGIVWAAWGGLVLDLLSAAPLGLNVLALMVGNLLAYPFASIPLPTPTLRVPIWVAITTVAYYAVIVLIFNIIWQMPNPVRAATTVIVPLAIINSALSVFAATILYRLQERLRQQEQLFSA